MRYYEFKNNSIQKFNNGFTLAEVLITLVIIGVIAAMTIPTLMKNTQNQEFVAGVKKANSTLSQALINMANNNDAAVGDFSFINNIDFIDELAKLTNIVKKCNNSADCFGSSLSPGTVYKKMNNQPSSIVSGKSVITADGQMYTFATTVNDKYGISDDDIANLMAELP